MNVSPALARALAAGREGYNAKIRQASHRWPDFDTDAFASFLARTVAPLLDAVEAIAFDRVQAVTTVAYEFAIELVAQRLVGTDSRYPCVEQAWREVAPLYARLLADQPQAVLGSLANAAIQLSQFQVRVADWLAGMQTHADAITDLGQLHALGQLLAWRVGMAHYRAGALAAADRLPQGLALKILDARPDSVWPALSAAWAADPWYSPLGRAYGVGAQGLNVGAFSGFGGPFSQPPSLRAANDGFLVASGERHFLLVADIYGAVLLPATRLQFDGAAPGTAAVPQDRTAALGWCSRETVGVCNAHTLALVTSYSHVIALFPRT